MIRWRKLTTLNVCNATGKLEGLLKRMVEIVVGWLSCSISPLPSIDKGDNTFQVKFSTIRETLSLVRERLSVVKECLNPRNVVYRLRFLCKRSLAMVIFGNNFKNAPRSLQPRLFY